MRLPEPLRQTSILVPTIVLSFAGSALAAPPVKRAETAKRAEARQIPVTTWVSSPRLLISFDAASGGPGTTAELWYTADDQQSWQRSGKPTIQNPLTFDAPDDGLYGFFIILRNEAGSSSNPPKPGTKAQQWIGVDRTAPAVQILAIRVDPHFDLNREVHIRWRVRDDHIGPRPAAIHYRLPGSKTYTMLADSLEGDGIYRWTLPEKIEGRIDIKVSARDQAGNVGRCEYDWLTVKNGKARVIMNAPREDKLGSAEGAKDTTGKDGSNSVVKLADTGTGPFVAQPGYSEPQGPATGDTDAAAAAAKKEYDQATFHRLRGEHEIALEHYQRALKIEPSLLAARNDLAGLLCLMRRYEEAQTQFESVLSREHENRIALRGLALVQATRKNYRSARESLEKLLLLEPKDAEAWVYFGDVMLFSGDRVAAREAWRKVENMKSASAELKQRASKRLTVYANDHLSGSAP